MGPAWGTTWFSFTGAVPPEWDGQEVEAVIDLGFGRGPGFTAEGLIYLPDGSPVHGLHPRQRSVRLSQLAPSDGSVRFFVEAAANPSIERPVTPLGDTLTAGDEPLYVLRQAELAVFDAEVWDLVHDLEVLGQLMQELPVDGPRRWEILRAVERALDALTCRTCRHRRGRPRRARPGAGRAGPRLRAPDLRGRARAHRLGLAVAAARDGPQGRPDRRPT